MDYGASGGDRRVTAANWELNIMSQIGNTSYLIEEIIIFANESKHPGTGSFLSLGKRPCPLLISFVDIHHGATSHSDDGWGHDGRRGLLTLPLRFFHISIMDIQYLIPVLLLHTSHFSSSTK